MRAFLARCAAAALTAGPAVVMSPGAPLHTMCADAAGTGRAAVVVEHGGGAVLTSCVGFNGGTISGYDLLAASGIQFATVDYGGSLGQAVCQIDHEPPSYPPSCFSNGGAYWAIFASRRGGGWQLTSRGVSNTSFADGDAEGFRYDDQGGGLPAPDKPAAGVCPAQQPPPVTPSASTSSAPTPPPPTSTSPSSGGAPTLGGGGASTPSLSPTATTVEPPATGDRGNAGSLGDAVPPPSTTVAPHADAARASPTVPSSSTTAWMSASAALAAMLGLLGWQLLRRRRA